MSKSNLWPIFWQKFLLVLIFLVVLIVFLVSDQKGFSDTPFFYTPILIISSLAIILCLFFLSISIWKKKVIFIKDGCWPPLLFLAVSLLLSGLLNQSSTNHAFWLGEGLLGWSLIIIAIIISSLFSPKINKTTTFLNQILIFLISVIAFLVSMQNLFNIYFLSFSIDLYPSTWMMILGSFLGMIIIIFVRKGKIPLGYKALLSFLVLGVISGAILSLKPEDELWKKSEVAPLNVSYQTLVNAWTDKKGSIGEKIAWRLWGWGNNYEVFYNQYKPEWINQSVWTESEFKQSSFGIMTIASNYGLIGVIGILWLVGSLWKQLKKQFSEGNYLFISTVILITGQLFLPLDPIIMLMGAVWLGLSKTNIEKKYVWELEWRKKSKTKLILDKEKNFQLDVNMHEKENKQIKTLRQKLIAWSKNSGQDYLKMFRGWLVVALIVLLLIAGWKIIVSWQTKNLYEKQLWTEAAKLQPKIAEFYAREAAEILEFSVDSLAKGQKPTELELSQADKKINNALYLAEKAIKIDPNNQENWLLLGDIYRQVAQITTNPDQSWTNALTAYEEAQKIAPQNSLVLRKMGLIYLDQNQITKAREYFKQASETQPRLSINFYMLANVYVQEENWIEAEKNYQIAMELLDVTQATYEMDRETINQELKKIEKQKTN